ncbi:DUF3606 domain-containing protein [Tianweitania sp. BSSL-BM11]|uniref:DUF3606 domain-containing protein n=1 Tax=Tianweitania aestuarii TaxID=2814886 RepID=A0ABS5RW37_9HYPH|nr:DUF3606 domain-containing protein [Tianweitania aestuarii]MBS9721258.1 DUF3606 domain-containing protein [Tianweitania aestuarii]
MTTKSAGKVDPKAGSADTYEAAAFAAKFGVPISEAKTIIKRYGPSRRKLDTYMEARGA